MIKNFLKLAGIFSVFMAHQAFSWNFGVTNLSNVRHWAEAKYPGCSNDKFYINPGQTVNVDAKGCLLAEIMVHNHRQIPYKSSGQRYYTDFYIIGPVEGEYLTGRFE